MTDRATPIGGLPNACPFLALEEDRDRRSTVPDGRHRCYAEPEPQPRALTYQETFCLAPAFSTCRSFLDWAARAAAAPTRTLPGPVAPAVPPLVAIPEDPDPPAPAADAVPPWTAPPPWVAEPAIRSTASLPTPPRAPLDVTPSGSAWTDGFPAPDGDELPLDEVSPTWPPAAPSMGEVQGTFGSRRGPDRDPPRRDAAAAGGAAQPSGMPTDDWSPAQSAAMAGWDVAAAGAAAGWATSQASAAQPLAPPPPADPTPIPVDRMPLAPVPSAPVPFLGDAADAPDPAAPGWTDAGVPVPLAPPPSVPLAPPAAAPAAPLQPTPRRPASRWLPSFLTPDPSSTGGDPGVTARTGTAGAAETDEDWEAVPGWVEDEELWPAGSAPAGAAAPDPAPITPAPRPAPLAGAATLAPSTAGPAPRAAAADPLADDPVVSSPAARRRRRGVPVDAKAPSSVPDQATPSRTQGSGEWIRPRRQATLGGRSFDPPPLLLGLVGLLVAAAILFLLPGFLAGGGGPTPAPPTLAAATDGPARTRAPKQSVEPSATPSPDDGFRIYIIKPGDTLIDIARRFKTTQTLLICANPALRKNPDRVLVGQELRIPPDDYECKTPARTRKP